MLLWDSHVLTLTESQLEEGQELWNNFRAFRFPFWDDPDWQIGILIDGSIGDGRPNAGAGVTSTASLFIVLPAVPTWLW